MVKKNNLVCFRPSVIFGGMTSILFIIIAIVSLVIGGMLYYIPKYNSQQAVFQQQLLKKVSEKPAPVVIREQRSSDRSYPTGKYVPRDSDFSSFTNVGYIFNDDGRFPLYMNRLNNRFYYFTRDDSRNNIKITIGDAERGLKDEYFDGDTVSVPELSSSLFNIKIYENKTNIYNPFGINVY